MKHTHIKSNNPKKFGVLSLSLLVQSAFIYSLTVYPVAHSQSHVRAPGQIYIDVYVAGITKAPSGAHTYLNTFVTVRSNMTCIAPSLSTQNTHTEEKEPPQKKKTRTLIYKGSFLSQPAGSFQLSPAMWFCGKKEFAEREWDKTSVLDCLCTRDPSTRPAVHIAAAAAEATWQQWPV
jgi:hypothetical protein